MTDRPTTCAQRSVSGSADASQDESSDEGEADEKDDETYHSFVRPSLAHRRHSFLANEIAMHVLEKSNGDDI